MAGTLPGLATLAGANGLYIVLLLTGGMVVPLDELPTALATVAKVLPAAPLAEILTGSLIAGRSVEPWAWVSLGDLGRWCAARRRRSCSFRWE